MKICIVATVAFFVGIGLWSKSKAHVYANELVMDNVEALATGEDDKTYTCLSESSVDCPDGGEKVGWVGIRSVVHK